MFAQRNEADKFLSFLESVVPVEVKTSKQIISEDIHTSTKQYKHTFSVNIAPVCKDDLVALPIKLAKQIGNISPLVLCWRIGTSINLLDPSTLQTAEVSSKVYWRTPFTPLADVKELVEFTVLEVEDTGVEKGKWHLCEASVAPVSDYSKEYFVRTHLPLRPGDEVMGYLLTGSNYNSTSFDEIEASHTYGSTIPDVILVKKHNPNRRKNKKRNWKLKRMAKDEGELLPKKADQERLDAEYEMFLQDVEEDAELRAALALYKNTNKKKQQQQDPDAMSVAETEMTVDDGTGVNMEELLDDFDELDIEDNMQEG
jgi:nonsense-mediated mRNA decay protein 3